MTTPTTDRAYARGEDAPAELLGVRVALARNLTTTAIAAGYGFYATDDDGYQVGPTFAALAACEQWVEAKGPELTVTYWVGVDDSGAANVQAAIDRAEGDHPGYTAQDWEAA